MLALLVYTAFIVYQSVAGGGAWDCSNAVLGGSARFSRSDALANVVAYVPLGLLLVLVMHSSTGRVLPAIVGAVVAIGLLSASLETAQACQSHRVSSVYDLIANVSGGVLGMAAALVFRGVATTTGARPASRVDVPDRRLRLLTLVLVGAWVVSQTMPWVFAVDVGTVRSNLSFLRRWSDVESLDAWRVLRHAGAWVAIGCACRLVWRDTWQAATALAMTACLSLVLQLLLDAKAPLSYEELTGMALAGMTMLAAVSFGSGTPRQRRRAGGLLAGAMVAVVAYELQPEPSAALQAFSWWPRVGLGGLLGAVDYALLFGWFGLAAVVAARWAAGDGDRYARRWWPVIAVLLTFLCEVLQTRIPGRGPDVSAPLFTALAVLVGTGLLADTERRRP